MKKRILCFGDSNTYGYVPAGGGRRYGENIRWPSRLSGLLGEGYTVIEEGLPGRTADLCEEYPWKEGKAYLYAALSTHRPVDMALIMLGTNDTKKAFHRDAKKIADTVREIVEMTRSFFMEKQGYAPKIFLISPVHIHESVGNGPFGDDFDSRSAMVSTQLAEEFRIIAESHDCLFLDASLYAEPSLIDCVHMDPSGHLKLADAVYDVIHRWYADHPDETDQPHRAMIEN